MNNLKPEDIKKSKDKKFLEGSCFKELYESCEVAQKQVENLALKFLFLL